MLAIVVSIQGLSTLFGELACFLPVALWSVLTSWAAAMALSGGAADNLKIGDVVLLYYNADKRFATDSGDQSGFILADLSG